jgi:hypothetical protein
MNEVNGPFVSFVPCFAPRARVARLGRSTLDACRGSQRVPARSRGVLCWSREPTPGVRRIGGSASTHVPAGRVSGRGSCGSTRDARSQGATDLPRTSTTSSRGPMAEAMRGATCGRTATRTTRPRPSAKTEGWVALVTDTAQGFDTPVCGRWLPSVCQRSRSLRGALRGVHADGVAGSTLRRGGTPLSPSSAAPTTDATLPVHGRLCGAW